MKETIQITEDKMLSGETGLFYWWDIYSTNLTITTKHKCRTETLNIHKKRKMRETSQKTTKSTWQTESHTHTHTHTHTNWRQSNQKSKHKMAVLGSHLSISTLNVNRLNSPIKTYRVAKWILKNTTIYCV